jgi:hypothetical protein
MKRTLFSIICLFLALSTSKSQDAGVSRMPTDIVAAFVKTELQVRENLNQHTFKRDVLLQTIGPNGEVTGEYVRNSQFVFDDKGNRIERVTFHPPSTIREMRITKEDIQDLAGAQLLGFDVSEIGKYRLTYMAEDTIEGKRVYVLTVEPALKPDPYHMRERFFVGHVWIDSENFQIVKVKGSVQPQGKQRFPVFETWREPVAGTLNLPARTEADDILRFPKRNVNYRMRVRYYDYKLFASKVTITAIDEPAQESDQESDQVCIENQTAPAQGSYHWPPETEVKVYFAATMFNAEQRKKLLAAMNLWSEIAVKTGADVKFVYAGEVDTIARCTACLTVTRRSVHSNDPRHFAMFEPLEMNKEWLLISARIDLDFATTNAEALQGYMVHELGHSLGLRDCIDCKKKTTVMNGFPAINHHNGLIAPSNCDVKVVQQVYKGQQREANRIASAPLK